VEKYAAAQNIARETMRDLYDFIQVGMSEKEIYDQAIALMTRKGSNSWWYHGLGALVLLGERSVVSVSGTQYIPSKDHCVSEDDVVTIDLAPTLDGYWGDYARMIFVENGRVVEEDQLSTELFQEGLAAEWTLHAKLCAMADLDLTYEDVFYQLNQEITQLGFENLDFHGNLGHSIEFDQANRIYIEKGNQTTFRESGKPFTLEPHIRKLGGTVGFKREDIYYFNETGALQRL